MSTKHTFVRILKDGMTMNGQVCMAGDIMMDPPYPVLQSIKENGGVLGKCGKVFELVDEKTAAKLQIDESDPGKVHSPEKTVHTDPEGLKVQPIVKKKFPAPAKKKAPAKKEPEKKPAVNKKAAKKKSR